MSPDSATSPTTATSGGIGVPSLADARARQIARSADGSDSLAPPTVATKTSLAPALRSAARSVTASSIATRELSRPLTPRRGLAELASAISAWISAGIARRPSTVMVTQVPGTGRSRWPRNRSAGSGTSRRPSSPCSKQTTSSAGPYRFLTVRSSRRLVCLSPSNVSTVSTMCSSARGPATAFSRVDCPISSSGMCRALAIRVRTAATSCTWVTPPARPSMADDAIAWTLSTISSRGWCASTWPIRLPRSLSSASSTPGATAPIRRARRVICSTLSSPGDVEDAVVRVARWPRRGRRWTAASTCPRPARRPAGRPGRRPARHRAPGRTRRDRSARAGSRRRRRRRAVGRAGRGRCPLRRCADRAAPGWTWPRRRCRTRSSGDSGRPTAAAPPGRRSRRRTPPS